MEATLDPVGEWLGMSVPAAEGDILGIVERQLAPSVITRLVAHGLERSEIDATIIASRTLQHRRSRREKLTVAESDRLMRVVRAVSAAETVYGSREKALGWMRTAHPRLNGRTPLSLLNTDTGTRMVEDLLVQIDEGMFV